MIELNEIWRRQNLIKHHLEQQNYLKNQAKNDKDNKGYIAHSVIEGQYQTLLDCYDAMERYTNSKWKFKIE